MVALAVHRVVRRDRSSVRARKRDLAEHLATADRRAADERAHRGEARSLRLTAAALGGLARSLAGLVCIALAAWQEGLGPASAALVPFLLGLAWSILAISALLARAGVARPDLDVVQFVVRWGKREKDLAPISIGASVFQFAISIVTVPAVKLLPPSVLYQPEIAPSPSALLSILGVSVALFALVYWLWSGHVQLSAPREQQREAEEHS